MHTLIRPAAILAMVAFPALVGAQDTDLANLRREFRQVGPDPKVVNLAKELRMKFPKDAKIKQLAADIEKAATIKKAVPPAPPPEDLAPPFAELKFFVKHLDEHLGLGENASRELRDWAQAFRRQCIAPAAMPALDNLAGLWEPLNKDIPAMAEKKLKALRESLELLEVSRGRLAGIFSDAGHRKALDDRVPMAAITGRLAQCNGRLEELQIRSRFCIVGPAEDVLEAARELRRRFPDDPEIKQLLTDFTEARTMKQVVGMPDIVVKPPFDEVKRFVTNLDKELQVSNKAGPELRAWVGGFRQRRIAIVREPALVKLAALWVKLDKDVPPMEKRDLKDLKAELERFKRGRDTLASIFKDAEDAKGLDKRIPMAAITGRLAQCNGRLEELEIRALIKAHHGDVMAVTGLANWKRQRQGLQKGLADLETTAQAWSEKSGLDIVLLKTDLAVNRKEIDKWRALEAGISQCVETFAVRKLAKTDSALAAVEENYSHAVVGNFRMAVASMQRGFDALLERLKLPEARSHFEKAKDQIYKVEGSLGPGGQYVAACLARINKLEKHVDQMAPVPANEIRFHDGKTVKVASIYIDCCEVSNKNFIDFLKGMAHYRNKWADLKKKYPGMWTTNSRFQRALHRLDDSQKSDLLPVDGVSYYEAIAFVVSRDKDLPTWEEWWLAAKGHADANVPRFPWGDQMAKVGNAKELNQHNTPVDVNSGGECHRDKTIHHLAGNMAEWLKVDDVRGTKYGKLIGGSYSEVGRGIQEQLKLYAGEKCLRAELWKKEEGFGFRGVLRPRTYFADLVPVKD